MKKSYYQPEDLKNSAQLQSGNETLGEKFLTTTQRSLKTVI